MEFQPGPQAEADGGTVRGEKSPDHSLHFSGPESIVGIQKADNVAGRCVEPPIRVSRLSEVLSLHQADAGVCSFVASNNCRCVVFRTVICNHDFQFCVILAEHAVERIANEPSVVIRRNNDRYKRFTA
jgi:hypothetical protein